MSIETGLATVIIPVRDSVENLGRAVDSALRQSYGNLELLLVVDGASGEFEGVCNHYVRQCAKVRVVRGEAHPGVGAARNAGLDAAKGEYVCFLGSNDSLPVGSIGSMVSAMREDDVDLAIGWLAMSAVTGVHDGNPLELGRDESTAVSVLTTRRMNMGTADLLCHCFFGVFARDCSDIRGQIQSCMGKLFRKRVIDSNHIRFDPALRHGEDGLFILKYLGEAGRVAFLDTLAYKAYGRHIVHEELAGENCVDFFKCVARLFFEQYASIEKKCTSVPIFVKQQFYQEFVACLVRGAGFADYLGRDCYRAALNELLLNPLVVEATRACKDNGDSSGRLIAFFFRRGWLWPLYWHLLRRGRKYAASLRKSLPLSSVYRMESVSR